MKEALTYILNQLNKIRTSGEDTITMAQTIITVTQLLAEIEKNQPEDTNPETDNKKAK